MSDLTARGTPRQRRTSPARVAHSRVANWKHGMTSTFAQTGDESALTEPQRSRLAEIRAGLETPDGALDVLRDRAARMVLLCEWGESYLRDIAERYGGAAAFQVKMLQRFVSVVESSRRHLELLIRLEGRGDGGLSAAEVLDAMKDGSREQDE